jgi:hypothetical protein
MTLSSRRFFIWVYLPAFALLIAITLGSIRSGTPIYTLMRDPLAVVHAHPLTGLVSNLGVILWCACAAVCLFAGAVVSRTGPREVFWFLLCSGLLTLLVLLDDLFQFHESLAVHYLGVDQRSVLAGYMVLTIAYLATFHRRIREFAWIHLLVALGLFATSTLIDETGWWIWSLEPWEGHFVEDSIKFLGIAAWMGYFVHAAFVVLTGRRDA